MCARRRLGIRQDAGTIDDLGSNCSDLAAGVGAF
jgi:hypothetical protein